MLGLVAGEFGSRENFQALGITENQIQNKKQLHIPKAGGKLSYWELLGAPWELLGAPCRNMHIGWEILEAPSGLLGAPWELLGAPWERLGAPWEFLGDP